jgi:hypothetical protein
MDNLQEDLSVAYKKGLLLQAIHEKAIGHWDKLETLIEDLAKTHNNREIDLISTFQALKNEPNTGPDFFLMRDVFEKALPKLNAEVAEVMNCVISLVAEAGNDMAAGTILPAFVEFCVAETNRPKEALSLFTNNVIQFQSLLPQILVAGARLDVESYTIEAIKLAHDQSVEIRRIAIFSLGLIEYPKEEKHLSELVLSCLQASLIEETDDQLLGRLIRSEFNLFKTYHFPIECLTDNIDQALSKGDDHTLHTAAGIFSHDGQKIPTFLLDRILSHLVRVKPANKRTLNRIDFGLVELLQGENREKAIKFLETILLANQETLSLKAFESVTHELLKNQDGLLNLLMTRWFMKGYRVLCEGISSVVENAIEHDIILRIEPSELDSNDPLCFIFVARKSIGYLFPAPVTVASIIISLVENASSEDVIHDLTFLLFDLIVLNYPGKVIDYLKAVGDGTENVTVAIKTVFKYYDDYMKHISAARKIPELRPSQSHRDAYNRHFSQLMADQMRKAEEESKLFSLFSKSVLLYGRTSIDYVFDPDGKSRRIEIPLRSHKTEMEFPRLGIIDPFGLDYMLLIYRIERRRI